MLMGGYRVKKITTPMDFNGNGLSTHGGLIPEIAPSMGGTDFQRSTNPLIFVDINATRTPLPSAINAWVALSVRHPLLPTGTRTLATRHRTAAPENPEKAVQS